MKDTGPNNLMRHPFRPFLFVMMMGICGGCHHGVKGTLVIENDTGRDLYCLWTIAPADSIREMPVSLSEDSLHLDLLKDGDKKSVVLPSRYSGTDRVTIRMYSLDGVTYPRRYRLESLTMTSVQRIDASDWSPVVIKNIKMGSSDPSAR